jgi:nicotinic acid mononucleotide adenylyltransferase
MHHSIEEIQHILNGLNPEDEPRVELTGELPESKTLGVLDSSFNPPTQAHVRMLELAKQKEDFDLNLLLLAKQNVDKTVFGESLEHRVLMMESLAESIPDTAVGMTAHGRFVDKAKALKSLFGKECEIHFILGFDTVVRLFDSKYYDDMNAALSELFGLASVIFFNRQGYSAADTEEFLLTPDVRDYSESLVFIELEAEYAAMSSTDARSALETQQPAEALIPKGVLKMVRKRGFYCR